MRKRIVHHKYKYIQWLLLYGIFYLLSFALLENSNVPVHTIHCSLDDKIPFCEYFVIPYLLWFAFLGVTLLYFGVVCKERKEYIRLAVSFCFGMTVFLIVSFVYPNGHNLRPELEAKRNVLIGLVIISAITDVLDGKIARKYNMVSEVGKIIDPIADKVTQGVLLLCFIEQYPIIRPIFVLFLCKECFMLIMGTRTVIKTQKNDGSLWFGKINTVVFYSVMIILVFCKNISEQFAEALLLVSGICMAAAFGLYALSYRSKIKKAESYHSV